MADSTQDTSGQHADGISHIASNTAPPGTTDTSRGTEAGGGVSSSADLEQTSSQGGMIETVKSYLGMSGSGNASEGRTGEGRNTADSSTGSGSGAGITVAAASAASALGLGSGNAAAGGGVGSTSSSSGGDTAAGSSTLETAKEKVQEVTNTVGSKTVTSGTDDHKPPQPAGGKPHKMENESAIPTAGGERLGEKHWGESRIVPDNPEPRASEAGIASEEGQPTQQTSDNTAKNMGGASGPPGSAAVRGGDGVGEEKTKLTDKIKDKLNIGKKE